jgi:hypothetical protein
VGPIRQTDTSGPVSLFEMDREQAERERERMADEHPEATWLVAEQQPGEWAVVKVGLVPADSDLASATEARPKPDHADDPRSHLGRNNPYGGV